MQTTTVKSLLWQNKHHIHICNLWGEISVKPGIIIINSDICSHITFNPYSLVERESELIYFFNCYYCCGVCGSYNQLSPNSFEDQLTKGRHAMCNLCFS